MQKHEEKKSYLLYSPPIFICYDIAVFRRGQCDENPYVRTPSEIIPEPTQEVLETPASKESECICGRAHLLSTQHILIFHQA